MGEQEDSLINMQKKLYTAITQSVIRELREEGVWIIDQAVLNAFDPLRMYPIVEKEDVPWRAWQNWLRERITSFCRQNGKLNIVPNSTIYRPLSFSSVNSMQSMGSVVTNPVPQFSVNPPQPMPMQPQPQNMAPRVSLQQIHQLRQQFPLQDPVAPQPTISVPSEPVMMPQYENPVDPDGACQVQ